jgi:gluconokinase
MRTRFVILMGVSGSGKTSVGTLLAHQLGWSFYDADAFHPPENVAKMTSGIPLDDADRLPWLAALHGLISTGLKENRPGVLACSALKESYRRKLLEGNQGILVVYLKGSYELIWSRMADRKDHFMKPQMLKSQFESLEEPTGALILDISKPVEELVQKILERID